VTGLFLYTKSERMEIKMRNRTILGIFCIFLAVAVMFGIAPIVNKLSAAKTDIVRVTEDISKGKQITDKDVKMVTVGGFNLPKSIIKDKKSVIGKYAVCDLKAEDYILPSKIKETSDNSDDIFRKLESGKQAISITISSFAGGLSGKLQNGDIISIITIKDKTSFVPAELSYVKLITATTSKGTDSDMIKVKEDGTSDLPSTVTLLVNPTQAKLLALYEKTAALHITLIYRGDNINADKYLEAQDKVFESEVTGNE
jgi:pilus assembly protein CpaB